MLPSAWPRNPAQGGRGRRPARLSPNRAARTLPKGRSFTIGYCIPAGRDGFFLDTFLHQITERASDVGMDIHLFTHNRGQSEADSIGT